MNIKRKNCFERGEIFHQKSVAHVAYIPIHKFKDIYRWCNELLDNNWGVVYNGGNYSIYFLNEEDHVLFRMTFDFSSASANLGELQ